MIKIYIEGMRVSDNKYVCQIINEIVYFYCLNRIEKMRTCKLYEA